ncbi:sensor histidine kinase [Flavobacterium sp. LB2P44]|uniref:sensor histidine kinase n=1 Tax=Flavobacterium sp. LB2P44 TaxID=3401713 RepID=UPI003AAFA374
MDWGTNGKMTKKLLHKTLNYYITFSLMVMLLGIPLFFFIIQLLYLHETDEALIVQKKEFILFYATQIKDNEIYAFNTLNRDLKIEKEQTKISKDTFYKKSFYNILKKKNEPYRVLKTPVFINNKPYVFSAKINLIDNSDLIISILCVFTLIILILLLGLFSITKRISTTLWKPFYETLQQIEKFEIDRNSNPQLALNTIEEFNRLNTVLNKWIEKNTLIYKSQKEFIENAAHELQTPIAIFKGKIEVLLQRSDVTKGQFEILDTLNQTITRINRLNKNLLLLSKIESKMYNIPEVVAIKNTITSQLDFFKEQAIAKNIAITTHLESDVLLNTNAFLSEIMIKNLFLNAINHNIINGSIKVFLDENSLIFSNTGIPKSLETDTLFERFSKVNPSSKGNGLGLSIIKKIAENNTWKVSYHFKDNLHIFEIQF